MRCNKCLLYKTSKAGKYTLVKLEGVGNKTADIMLVGEAPGYNEIVKGKPFIGKAGQKLRNVLKSVGINSEDIYITNVVKCRPPQNRTPTDSEIKECSSYLEKEIEEIKPKVIGMLGNVPLKYFMNTKGITKFRGIETWSDKHSCWLLPIYHPSYVIRFPNKSKQNDDFKCDLGKLKRLLTKKNLTRKKTNYKTIKTIEHLKKLIKLLLKQEIVSYDLETDKLEFFDNTILGCSFSFKEETAVYIPVEDKRFWTEEQSKIVLKLLKVFFESDVKKIAQNGKFDNKHLLSKGIKVNNFYFDTMLAHYLLDEEGNHNLNHLAMIYTDIGKYKDEIREYITGKIKIKEKIKTKKKYGLFDKYIEKEIKKKSSIWDAPIEDLIEYSCKDADATFRIYTPLNELLKEEGLDKLFYKVVMPASEVLQIMEFRGVKLDEEYIKKISSRFRSKIKSFSADINNNKYIKETAKKLNLKEVNLNSPIQLRTLLFDVLNLEPINRSLRTKEPSTDKETLEKLNKKHKVKILDSILRYRKAQKFYTTYIEAYEKILDKSGDKCIHTTYSLSRTRTGRLASENPNLQNIPKRDEEAKIVRKALVARKGYTLVECDYKQLEFRVFAHCVNSKKLIKVASEKDIHRTIASKIFKINPEKITDKQRSMAKTAVFGGILYMGGSHIIVSTFGVSYREAEKILNEFFEEFPTAQEYIDNQLKFARKNQYVVNIFGRRRRVIDILNSDEFKRTSAERQAVNATIQSSASDIVLIAMAKLLREVDSEETCRILMNIHDSVIFEVKDEVLDKKIIEITNIMNNPVKLRVPLVVDIESGKNLGDMQK